MGSALWLLGWELPASLLLPVNAAMPFPPVFLNKEGNPNYFPICTVCFGVERCPQQGGGHRAALGEVPVDAPPAPHAASLLRGGVLGWGEQCKVRARHHNSFWPKLPDVPWGGGRLLDQGPAGSWNWGLGTQELLMTAHGISFLFSFWVTAEFFPLHGLPSPVVLLRNGISRTKLPPAPQSKLPNWECVFAVLSQM